MAWYYGFNKSDLYGSNFSTVLADAPPPLDDTEEEDNDIVFRNQGKKLKTICEKPVSPVPKMLHLQSSGDESNFDMTSKSPLGDHFSPDDKISDQDKVGHTDLHQESDFGDFAGFADFNSAFGQENGEQTSQSWFNSEGNGTFIVNGEIEMTEKTEISDSRDVDKCAYDNEMVSCGRSPEKGSVHMRSLNQSKVYSNNSSLHEVESDDDFGNFASVISNHGNQKSVTLGGNGMKGTTKSSGTEVRASRNESTDIASEDDSFIQKSNRGTKQFGEVCKSDEDLVHQPETGASDHNEKSHFNMPHTTGNEKQCSDTNTLCVEDEGFVGFSIDPCSGGESGFIDEDHGSHIQKQAVDNHNGKITTSGISIPVPHEKENVLKCDTQTNHKKIELKDVLNVTCNNSSTATSKEELSKQKIAESTTTQSVPDKSYSDSWNSNQDVETKSLSSVNSDMGGKFIASATPLQRTKLNLATESLEGSITGLGNQLESGMIAEGNESYDDSFGEFSDFNSTTVKSTTGVKGLQIHSQFHNAPERGDVNVAANSLCHSDQEDKERSFKGTLSFAESKDDSDIGYLSPSDFQLRSSLEDTSNDGSFGNFGTFDFKAGKSLTRLKVVDDFDDKFGEFGDFSTQTGDSLNEYDNDDNFGAFRAFDSQPNSETEKEKSDHLKADNVPEEDQNNDSFGDFGSFDSNAEASSTRDKNEDDKFGDYGSFASPIVNSSKENGSEDNFGDFSAFDSVSKNVPNKDHSDKNFVGFVTFESNMKDSQAENQSESDFGNFGAFDSQSKCVDDFGYFETSRTEGSHTKQNLVKDDFGDFDAFGAAQSFSTQNVGEFGHFSDANASDSSGFADFPSLQHSKGIESSLRENIDMNIPKMSTEVKKAAHDSTGERAKANSQWNTLDKGRTDKLFTPGSNVIIAQAEKPVSLCFSVPGLTRDGSSSNCDVLASLIEKDMQSSNSKVWHHLETSEEGKMPFSWANSFNKHKKLLSLNVRPEKPPTQLGSVLKPLMASFGVGLGGSILVPEPMSKLHQSIATSGLLEPIRGSAEPVAHSVQNKSPSQLSLHPELALPDLSFVLSDGSKHTASKSDIKDNVSDTASESSSLDLDFFVPVTSALSSDSKADTRGLYEEDLLGLNIMSSEEFQKTDSPKPPKAADGNKVWQHGGVTIPLSSNQKRTQLSVVAKHIVEQLEDLRFMNSSVLMFPLKCE